MEKQVWRREEQVEICFLSIFRTIKTFTGFFHVVLESGDPKYFDDGG
jgi:hypothetical protein